jgi:outer membrane protein OmpA-like peptidoglycan-associated protein
MVPQLRQTPYRRRDERRRPPGERRTRALMEAERFTTPAGSFLPNKAALTPRGERFLRSVRGKLIAVASLRCDGYGASLRARPLLVGPLSLARAKLICAALRRLAPGAAPIAAVGRGASHPVASNHSESGRAANRRVVVTVMHRPTRVG